MAIEVYDFFADWTVISMRRERVINDANEISEWLAADTTLGEWCFIKAERGESMSFVFSRTITAMTFKLRFG